MQIVSRQISTLLGSANVSWDMWVNMALYQTGGQKALQNVSLQSHELVKLVGQSSVPDTANVYCLTEELPKKRDDIRASDLWRYCGGLKTKKVLQGFTNVPGRSLASTEFNREKSLFWVF